MKFGVREICDVTFKATDRRTIGNKTFEKYQPVFMIDTARTSTLEQGTTTVYAQGGKGYSRLIAWEGEKTMTFTVEDALMSPMGLAVLTGAGLIQADEDNKQHVHVAFDSEVEEKDGDYIAKVAWKDLMAALGLPADTPSKDVEICTDIDSFGTILDGSGAGIAWTKIAKGDIKRDEENSRGIHHEDTQSVNTIFKLGEISDLTGAAQTYGGYGIKLDFYVVMHSGVTEVDIKPESFGGFFYVEADTLYRREDSGQDMAASIVLPRVKVQSAFTFTMSASGDPSTFNFTMDAFPGYTMFDKSKKVMCVMQIIGADTKGDGEEGGAHSAHNPVDPQPEDAVQPGGPKNQ